MISVCDSVRACSKFFELWGMNALTESTRFSTRGSHKVPVGVSVGVSVGVLAGVSVETFSTCCASVTPLSPEVIRTAV